MQAAGKISTHVPQKLDYLAFGPPAVVRRIAVAITEERAVAAILSLQISNVGVPSYAFESFMADPDKWIIRSMKNQRGHRDPVHDVGRRSPRLVIIRARKSAVVGRNSVIKRS